MTRNINVFSPQHQFTPEEDTPTYSALLTTSKLHHLSDALSLISLILAFEVTEDPLKADAFVSPYLFGLYCSISFAGTDCPSLQLNEHELFNQWREDMIFLTPENAGKHIIIGSGEIANLPQKIIFEFREMIVLSGGPLSLPNHVVSVPYFYQKLKFVDKDLTWYSKFFGNVKSNFR